MAGLVDHREAPDPVLAHDPGGLGQGRGLAAGEDLLRHDVPPLAVGPGRGNAPPFMKPLGRPSGKRESVAARRRVELVPSEPPVPRPRRPSADAWTLEG